MAQYKYTEVTVETFLSAVREAWTESFPVYERQGNTIELGLQVIERDFRDSIVETSYGKSSSNISQLLADRPELSGTLGLNDLYIAEALRDDLEYAINLFE